MIGISIEELQRQLESLERIAARRDGSLQQQLAAFEAVSEAQRQLAAAQGLDYAVPLDVGCLPEAAVSGPVLFQTEQAAFLTFNAVKSDELGVHHPAGTAIVQIRRCLVTQFGYPNDEAIEGHPLSKRGLSAYGVYEVRNSVWVRQLTERNRVAFPKTPDSKQKHFILCFHDSSFECIGDTLDVTITEQPYAEIFASIARSSIGQ